MQPDAEYMRDYHAESPKIRFLELLTMGRRSADTNSCSVESLLSCPAQHFNY